MPGYKGDQPIDKLLNFIEGVPEKSSKKNRKSKSKMNNNIPKDVPVEQLPEDTRDDVERGKEMPNEQKRVPVYGVVRNPENSAFSKIPQVPIYN